MFTELTYGCSGTVPSVSNVGRVMLFNYLGKLLLQLLESVSNTFVWVVLEMDLTQWGIIAVLAVVTGFVALKTKL